MTTLDFSPLFRSTVGFDRLFPFFEDALRRDAAEVGYPPYNIEKTGEDSYRITMAVAGLGKEDLNVEARANTLLVSAKRREEVADNAYLHRGIAGRGGGLSRRARLQPSVPPCRPCQGRRRRSRKRPLAHRSRPRAAGRDETAPDRNFDLGAQEAVPRQ